MLLHRLSVHDRDFTIPQSEDVAELKAEVLSAVRNGGAYVSIPRPASSGGELEVLFTSASWVLWEQVECTEADGADGADGTDDAAYNLEY
jgi:hypothetical protein